jgi:hypothetical protein
LVSQNNLAEHKEDNVIMCIAFITANGNETTTIYFAEYMRDISEL